MKLHSEDIERLFSGELLEKKERRELTATIIARMVVLVSLLVLVYTILVPDADMAVAKRVMIACSIAIFCSQLVLILPGANYIIRGTLLLVGLFAAGAASEIDLCRLFFGRSSLFLAIPAVIVPIVLGPRYSCVYWVAVQIASVVVALTAPHKFSVFVSAMLLIVCIGVWMVTARADKVIDILSAAKKDAEDDRDEATAAIGIIVSAERNVIRESDAWLTSKEAEMAER